MRNISLLKITILVCLLTVSMIFTGIPTIQADSNTSGVVTLDSTGGNIAAGTLQTRVEATGISNANQVTELHIGTDVFGELNSTDIAYINTMVNIEVLDVASTITVENAGQDFMSSLNTTNFDNLREVTFPAKQFGTYAFYDCDSITTINLPEARIFGGYAFAKCDSLSSVSMPKAEDFSYNLFDDATVTSITFGETIPEIYMHWGTFTPGTLYVPLSALSAYDADHQVYSPTGTDDDGLWEGWTLVAGSPTTDAATPTINTQPSDVNCGIGDTETVSVSASVSDAGMLFYQWYLSTEDSNSGGTLISGATSNTYTVPTASSAITYYYCVVTNVNLTAIGNIVALTKTNTAEVNVGNRIPNRISTVNETDDETVKQRTAYSLDLSTVFEDLDNDSMTYEVSLDGGDFASANENFSFAPPSVGMYVLVFRAHDGQSYSTDTYTVNLTSLADADVDDDGDVDLQDITIIAQQYGNNNQAYDQNGDIIINVYDIVMVASEVE